MASTSQFIGLAKSLPAPLQRFFARYPPAAILPENTPKTRYQEERPNPFRFYKHPVTGKWQDPVYSQRRQAELVKMARENGVEDLLPETRKGTEYKLAHRVEHGLRVKGTGVGQKVKGHIHERHMIAKMETRRKAMLDMPSLIKRWKRVRSKIDCLDRPREHVLLTTLTGGQIRLDQVPQINKKKRDGMTALARPVHSPCIFMYNNISDRLVKERLCTQDPASLS
ncbi:hypothetical protein FOQG_00783 [Fusarium oxysporum f. sp. raphani 54005]|uniref:Large ribosomal subunit protein mL59 domain-containing protein n=7 Tax=Fusarium oxysporum species complex TaxID=171631 RepID=W9IU20_FUSOX|nr:hypothetical protein FOXG_01977 [Fusarium oxysporum f. sp. lycopersici 4287]XP_031057384.1 uncharacterized protein FOIG_12236 [Fusarium odoratissimum NRRL 54006]EWY98438.1 hypothetical protein FOYG_02927 [Fusarium oxysporum NRRL 32931]EWZ44513.1 hypothetical protein FOZG_05265 [Fusarium oxysporum Fo47]EWZ98609.1 hypothetical protein FOWG_02620 [Fusarium oxysporum f. sp. lycopersici MN25]EXA49797.1 hypothetical protein FOVG_02795 [Fusarium oxysporum f. sp. pisi HDV247]EXK41877.1 hypothetica